MCWRSTLIPMAFQGGFGQKHWYPLTVSKISTTQWLKNSLIDNDSEHENSQHLRTYYLPDTLCQAYYTF